MSGESDGGRPSEATPAPLADESDETVDLGDVGWADAPALAIFWVLAGVVFLQFFTRYVLNDSLGWTEEIARYLLIGVAFVGAIIPVRKNTHIYVEFFYRYLPARIGRGLSTFVDLGRIAFFVAVTYIAAKLALRTNQKMASIELSKSVVYWVVCAAFAAMTVYAVGVAWRHWRRHTSELTEPGPPAIMD
ncbi:MAG: TRAP transporter small permease [Rhodospirillales bacterium]|nr:TRAP transporter small permease [Rhodospirillales bacterium]MDH3791561.1 TRAP transporter small permease [Rhodospirillales bacterium]MDH3911036.1 TRAP transporter small permease [Rhodospirillales bacterium]MDH3918693.1 TRAP transporter small permease [Rhodospirillales bacterium]MDH3967903.1 TRAP transporter small permease [Rhodospirillales bacterium]